MELILSDLQTVGKALENRKIDAVKKAACEKLAVELNQCIRAHNVRLTDNERESIRDLFLLSNKPEIIVLNVTEGEYVEENLDVVIKKFAGALHIDPTKFVVICAKVESELAELNEEEQKQYLQELGVLISGLERLIQKAYDELGLISFYSRGEGSACLDN